MLYRLTGQGEAQLYSNLEQWHLFTEFYFKLNLFIIPFEFGLDTGLLNYQAGQHQTETAQ